MYLRLKKFLNEDWPTILACLIITSVMVFFNSEYRYPSDFKWVMIATSLPLILLYFCLSVFKTNKLELDFIDLSVIAIITYMAVSLAWSSDQLSGLDSLIKTLMITMVFFYFRYANPNLKATSATIITCALVVVAMAFLLPHEQWGGYFNENFITELLLLSLPAFLTLAIYSKPKFFEFHESVIPYYIFILSIIGALAVFVYLLAFNPSKIEFLLIPGSAILLALRYAYKKGIHRSNVRLIFGLIALLIVGLIGYCLHHWQGENGFLGSVMPRLILNGNSLAMWLDSPWIGHGIGSYNAIYSSYNDSYLLFFPHINPIPFGLNANIYAAHNEYLQFLVNQGLVGLLFLMLLLYSILKSKTAESIASHPYRLAAMLTLLMASLNSFIEFPLQNPATVLLIAVALGTIVRNPLGQNSKPAHTITFERPLVKFCFGASILLVMLASLGGAYRLHRSQIEFKEAIYLEYNHFHAEGMSHLLEAYRYNPLESRIRQQIYPLLNSWNRYLGTPPVSDAENKRLFYISLSAGASPLVVVRRLEYLLDTRQEKTAKLEIEQWIAFLERHYTDVPDTWISKAYYLSIVKNFDEADKAINHADHLAHNQNQSEQIITLRSMVNIGKSEKH